MEPRRIVRMASEHSEGTLASQHHQSPRPTPVSHETVCVLLCFVCLALDCGEICGGISVEFRHQFSPSTRGYCCSPFATFTMAALSLTCGVLGRCSLKQ